VEVALGQRLGVDSLPPVGVLRGEMEGGGRKVRGEEEGGGEGVVVK